ncbi:hypothetical protein [Pseudomonas sp. EpS/L25]|uniref:hypothetical protein n=1 Tax=Pseudomonas sp. EpS/L25 TaxID=1749078 RepID=UPI00128EAAFB|nr:hypothetical protein [Pseudomonas sp. EpS/L25]
MDTKLPNVSTKDAPTSESNTQQLAALPITTLQAICELCDRAVGSDHACPTGTETLALAEMRKKCLASIVNVHPSPDLLSEEELALLREVLVKKAPAGREQHQACAIKEGGVFLPEAYTASFRFANYIVGINRATDQNALNSIYDQSKGYLDALLDIGSHDCEVIDVLVMILDEGRELRLAELRLGEFP